MLQTTTMTAKAPNNAKKDTMSWLQTDRQEKMCSMEKMCWAFPTLSLPRIDETVCQSFKIAAAGRKT